MPTLIIRHVESSDPPQFQIVRLKDGKTTSPAAIASPTAWPVEDLPNSSLSAELRWYLEEFLDYPFPPNTDRAEHVQEALRGWGEQAFKALFDAGLGRDFYGEAYRAGLENLDVHIAGNDPGVLAWPWEALADPQHPGALAHHCRIERRLDGGHDPVDLHKNLPHDCINILFVTARPYEGDVRFRSLSRPVVEWIEKQELPAQVTILRPPTFKRLREHLKERPAYYHIVHFDGHGGYGMTAEADNSVAPHRFKGPQGHLIFENESGQPDAVSAETLGILLREHRIPVMVLNACRSAMVSDDAENAFASVAASLLQAGIRSVVAMAYSLYVSGAQEFLPSFYRRIFESGNLAEGMRAGRQAMLEQDGRVCARGRFPLEDWLVPVVYQQDPPDLRFAGADRRTVGEKPALPSEAQDSENLNFVGRDSALLQLERALRRPPAGILIHGMAGVGKTTLARGLVQWLRDTDGLGEGCFWFIFSDIRSSESVFNQLVAALFGTDAMAASFEQKQAALVKAFKKRRFILVWDNFESATGIAGTPLEARLPEADRQQLRDFLGQLRGGASKVIITSRSREAWLGSGHCFPLSLGGLQGEERWEYCAAILRDLDLEADQKDAELSDLMDWLNGHPLMMKVMLSQLQETRAGVLAERLRRRFDAEVGGDSSEQARLFAVLQFVEDALPAELQPLLFPLGLHERFVDANFLEAMAQRAGGRFSRADIDCLLAMLAVSGLLRLLGQDIYEMHPALTGFLRARPLVKQDDSQCEAWRRAFVDVMGRLANKLAFKEPHEQQMPFVLYGANFFAALANAESLRMNDHFGDLTQALGLYAQNQQDISSAIQRFKILADHYNQQGIARGEAAAYHMLGMIAQDQLNLTEARQWYQKSLILEERCNHEGGVAITNHQLGIIAEQQRAFKEAEHFHRKALEIWQKHDNELGIANSCHQLGVVFDEQWDLVSAEQYYHRALTIKKRLGDEYRSAVTYLQLGSIYEKQQNFLMAKEAGLQALAIWRKYNSEYEMANAYHLLGLTHQEYQDISVAEQYYLKAITIWEKYNNEYNAAKSYHNMGIMSRKKRSLAIAEQWFHKSIALKKKYGNKYDLASSYHELGILSQIQGNFLIARQYYQMSMEIKEKTNDMHGVACTYYQVAKLAFLQNSFEKCIYWLVRAISNFSLCHDFFHTKQSIKNLLFIYNRALPDKQVQLQKIWEEAGLGHSQLRQIWEGVGLEALPEDR